MLQVLQHHRGRDLGSDSCTVLLARRQEAQAAWLARHAALIGSVTCVHPLQEITPSLQQKCEAADDAVVDAGGSRWQAWQLTRVAQLQADAALTAALALPLQLCALDVDLPIDAVLQSLSLSRGGGASGTAVLPQLSALTSLTAAAPEGGALCAPLLSTLHQLCGLRRLVCRGHELCHDLGGLLRALAPLTALTHLAVLLDAPHPAADALAALPASLLRLSLPGLGCGDRHVSHLAHLSQLTRLSVLGLPASAVSQAGLAAQACLPSLQHLGLHVTRDASGGRPHVRGEVLPLLPLCCLLLPRGEEYPHQALAQHVAECSALTRLQLPLCLGHSAHVHDMVQLLGRLQRLEILTLRLTLVGCGAGERQGDPGALLRLLSSGSGSRTTAPACPSLRGLCLWWELDTDEPEGGDGAWPLLTWLLPALTRPEALHVLALRGQRSDFLCPPDALHQLVHAARCVRRLAMHDVCLDETALLQLWRKADVFPCLSDFAYVVSDSEERRLLDAALGQELRATRPHARSRVLALPLRSSRTDLLQLLWPDLYEWD